MDYKAYSEERRQQLVEGGFGFWVFRHDAIGCEGRHEDLDGLALPPDHPFWSRFYPPLDASCGCYVVGARFSSGIARLGGDAEKQVPAWCELPD